LIRRAISVSFADLLLAGSLRLSRALDRAAQSVAYGEEAATHYGELYPWFWALKEWAQGFYEGFVMAKIVIELEDTPAGLSFKFVGDDVRTAATIATNTAAQNVAISVCEHLREFGIKAPDLSGRKR